MHPPSPNPRWSVEGPKWDRLRTLAKDIYDQERHPKSQGPKTPMASGCFLYLEWFCHHPSPACVGPFLICPLGENVGFVPRREPLQD